MQSGYVKTYRKIKDSAVWWKKPALVYRGAWLTLLLRANFVDGTFDGMKIPAGSFATSLENLSTEFGCSVHKTRNILRFFEREGMITRQNYANRFTVITLCNWRLYNTFHEASCDTAANRRYSARQTGDLTDGNNRRKQKNETIEKRRGLRPSSHGSSRCVRPTLAELEAYKAELSYESLDCQHFLDVNDAKGWVYGKHAVVVKDWKALVRCWKRTESEIRQQEKPQNELRHQLDQLMEVEK